MSLLLGAAALLVGLTQFFAPPSAGDHAIPAVTWDAGTARVVAGDRNFIDGDLQVTLNNFGAAVLSLAMGRVAANAYPFLHIALEKSSEDLAVVVVWTNANGEKKSRTYAAQSKSLTSLWLATAELDGWEGNIDSLSLLVLGKPGETVLIRDFSIFPSSPWRQLQAIYSDLTVYEPWNRSAMNTNTGVTQVSSFYPIPLAVAFLILSLLAYGAMVVVSRRKLPFDPAVVALIFLASWVLLDLPWQYRLLHQVADTYRTFSGKNTQERLAVGPDAQLVKFVSQVKPQLAAEGSRVFVASSDQYSGMRVAYYLYPLNVYWSLQGPELPYENYLRRGDYVALVNPSTFRFNRKHNFLFAPDRANIPAELVFSNPIGTVVRLK